MDEKIHDLLRARDTYAAELKAIAAREADLPEDEALADDDAARFASLEKSIDTLDARIARMEGAAKKAAAGARPVAGASDEDEAEGRAAFANKMFPLNGSSITVREPSAPAPEKGLRAARFIIGSMVAKAQGPRAAAQFVADTFKDQVVAKALSISGGSATGGVLLPVDFRAELIELLRNRVAVRAINPTMVELPMGNLTLPRLAGGATANWGTEVSVIAQSDPSFDSIALSRKKLTAMVRISNDLIRFAPVSADAVVREDLVETLARAEDAAFLRADGTGNRPVGLLSIAGTTVLTAAGTTTDNTVAFLNAMAVAPRAKNSRMIRPAWIMNPRVKQFISTKRDGVGGFIYANELAQGKLMGMPVVDTAALPVNVVGYGGTGTAGSEIFLVDAADLVLGDSMTLDIQATDVGSVGGVGLFETDQCAFRAIQQVDLACRHPESVVVGKTDSWIV